MTMALTFCRQNPVKFEDGSRRYMPVDVFHATLRNDRAYFKKMAELADNSDVHRAIYMYLMTLDLSDFEPRAIPMTEAQMDMLMTDRHNVFTFLQHYLTEDPVGEPFQEDLHTPHAVLVQTEVLYRTYVSWITGQPFHVKAVEKRAMVKLLGKLDLKPKSTRRFKSCMEFDVVELTALMKERCMWDELV